MTSNQKALPLAVLLCLVPLVLAAYAQVIPKTNATLAERKAWKSALKIPDDWEESFETSQQAASGSGGLKFHSLGSGNYLVNIACYDGAYQTGFVIGYFDMSDPTVAKTLNFPGFESEDDNGKRVPYSQLAGTDIYHGKTKVLEIFTKWRGAGDCGQYVKYRIVGSKPIFIEGRVQDCERLHKNLDFTTWPKKSLRQIQRLNKSGKRH